MIFCVCCDLCVFHLVFVVFDEDKEFSQLPFIQRSSQDRFHKRFEAICGSA